MADANDLENRGPGANAEVPLTERSLLLGLREHREEAWDQMVRIYYPLVFSWCRRNGVSDHDIPDVVQNVFQAVAKDVSRFRQNHPGDSFRAWLRGITRNKLMDFHRQQGKQVTPTGGSSHVDAIASIPDPLDDEVDDQSVEVAAAVHRALELIRPAIDAQTWNAFWQVQMENQTPAETASALGMTQNAVYKAKARVLQRLRRQLGDLDE